MKRRPLMLGALVVLAACEAESGGGPLQVARADAPLAIDAEALLSVGVLSGDTQQEFDRVISPFVLPDGRLVVPLAGSRDMAAWRHDRGIWQSSAADHPLPAGRCRGDRPDSEWCVSGHECRGRTVGGRLGAGWCHGCGARRTRPDRRPSF